MKIRLLFALVMFALAIVVAYFNRLSFDAPPVSIFLSIRQLNREYMLVIPITAILIGFLVTRLLLTNRRLFLQQKHSQILFDHNGAGHLIVSSTRKIVQVNQQFCDLFGYEKEELIGRNALLLHLDRQHYEDWAPKFQEASVGRAMASEDYPWRRKDGSVFWCAFSGVRLSLRDGDPGVIWSVIDITERKHAEEELKLARFTMDTAADAVFWIGPDSSIEDVNVAACRSLGYAREELLSLAVADIDTQFAAKSWPAHWAELKAEKSLTFESTHIRKNGEEFPVEISSNHIHFGERQLDCAFVRDISERKRAEAERIMLESQLLHAQKLESLGVLAGGIAHDFNNILTAIIGNADLALMRLNPESPAVENLRRIEQSSLRAAELAKQMLAYSGKGKFVVESINVNRLVEEMLYMLEVSISKKSAMLLNLCPTLPCVEADATQLRQVIMNLVINASEAIGDKSGVIAITTGSMECDAGRARELWFEENIEGGLYVFLEISDTGCGMDRQTIRKIFDPFFTTKFTGRGLGMAAVLGIIRGHKGAINVHSEPGKGTTFRVLLPAGGTTDETSVSRSESCDWKAEGTVLLVDDEQTVRDIAGEMLAGLGYQVITAADGRQALEQYQAHPKIALILLDLTMPHLDGVQTFQALRKINPSVKVIISSGYSEQEISQKFAGQGLFGFVQKPYSLSALCEALRKTDYICG